MSRALRIVPRQGLRGVVFATVATASLAMPAAGSPLKTPRSKPDAVWWWPRTTAPQPLSPLAWLEDELVQRTDNRIGAARDLSMLRRYENPRVERPGEWRTFWTGRYGFGTWWQQSNLAWSSNACEPPSERAPVTLSAGQLRPLAALEPPRVSGIDVSPAWVMDAAVEPELGAEHAAPPECAAWQRPVSVSLARHGAEHDRFELLGCDGSIALDALDRVSVLARPPDVPHPGLPLPLEPDPEAALAGEWVPGVRLLDPRLVWVLAVLAESFPGRMIYLISGYRRDAGESFHKKGRALDLFVMGVKNADVLRVCRKLKDVACGFYPNNNFVHVDVRPPLTGHALWIDTSGPGQPSEYVDAWPGVVEGGALAWAGAEQ